MKRTAIERRTPLARGEKKLGARSKSHPRRTRHPLPLPTGKPVVLADVESETTAFGPQAKLCELTECAACFAVRWWRRGHPRNAALPWHLLEAGRDKVSIAHHEPHRSTTCKSTDRDTYPLCRKHHTDGVGKCVRHLLRSDATDAASFYRLLPFDWQAARDEMRLRVKLQTATLAASDGLVPVAIDTPAALAAERTP